MKTLAPIHRKAVNQAAYAAALQYELQIREKWTRELTETLEAGASFQELQEKTANLTRSQ